MTAEAKAVEMMSDALFSCLYRWVNGRPVERKDASAALVRHADSSTPYGSLAVALRELTTEGKPYEWLCDNGYLLTDQDRQRENRAALVAEYVGEAELKTLLCDMSRINRLLLAERPGIMRTSLPISIGSTGFDARQDYTIKGYLPANSLCSIYGPSGSYKSFLAMSWACHIATGRAWSGKRVVHGAVLYVVGEGGVGVPRRIKAWEMAHTDNQNIDSLYLVNRPVFPVREAEVNEVLLAARQVEAECGLPVVLVVFDTLARCFGGSDENDARDMGAFIVNATIFDRFSPFLMSAIHQPG